MRVGHHQRRCLRERFDERISTIGCFNDITPGALQQLAVQRTRLVIWFNHQDATSPPGVIVEHDGHFNTNPVLVTRSTSGRSRDGRALVLVTTREVSMAVVAALHRESRLWDP